MDGLYAGAFTPVDEGVAGVAVCEAVPLLVPLETAVQAHRYTALHLMLTVMRITMMPRGNQTGLLSASGLPTLRIRTLAPSL
jgi:hypothetical protein